MLYSHVTAQQKRKRFRELLAEDRCVQFPGTFTPLATSMIQEKGFDGVYISGGVLANELGLPDIGLTTLTEVATRGGQIARTTDLPTLIDADTGFGEAMNVARTIQELENAGLSGCHLEDQVNPKRCGHLDGKAVVDQDTAVQRLQAAAKAQRSVTIGYVDAHGTAHRRVVDPVAVGGGRLEAFDAAAGAMRTFALHRITDVADVD